MAKKSKKSDNYHVTPKGDKWQVIKAGAKKAFRVTKIQQEASDIGIALAKKAKGELSIHGKDGKIREKSSYGNDPYPPKDKT